MTLYELTTLQSPYAELSPSELLSRLNRGSLTPPRDLTPSIPRDLETIVLKSIAYDPGDRYQSGAEMARDLRNFLEDRPIRASRANPIERVWRWGRRNRPAAAMAVLAAIAAILAMIVGWVGYAVNASALRRSDANVALSLEVFGDLFDKLSAHDSISTPPIGEVEGAPPGGPPSGRDFCGPPPGDRPPGREFGQHPPPSGERPSHDGFDGHPPPGGPPPGFDERERPMEWQLVPRPSQGDPFGPGQQPGRAGDMELLRNVLTFYERFARENAQNPRLEIEAAWAYRKIGYIYEQLAKAEDSRLAFAHSIAMFESLVARYPGVAEYRFRLVQTYDMADPRTNMPTDVNGREQQERWLRRAEFLIDRLVAKYPEHEEYAWYLIRVHVKLGWTLDHEGRLDEAERWYREAIEFEGKYVARENSNWAFRIDRATTREALALVIARRDLRDEARSLLEGAVEDLKCLTAQEGTPPLQGRVLSLSQAFEKLGETDRSEDMVRWASELRTRPPRPPSLDGRGGPLRTKQ